MDYKTFLTLAMIWGSSVTLAAATTQPIAYVSGKQKQQDLRSSTTLAKEWNLAILRLDYDKIREIEQKHDWKPRLREDIPEMRRKRLESQIARGDRISGSEKWQFLNHPNNEAILIAYLRAMNGRDWNALRSLEEKHKFPPIEVERLEQQRSQILFMLDSFPPEKKASYFGDKN